MSEQERPKKYVNGVLTDCSDEDIAQMAQDAAAVAPAEQPPPEPKAEPKAEPPADDEHEHEHKKGSHHHGKRRAK